jgi:hypothetical protein
MARYKVTKEQLERIVENFVMEAATAKAPVKNHIPSQGAEAKKHVKNKVTGRIVEPSEGVPATPAMKKKLSQAPEAKKHMSKGGTKHTNKASVMKESELFNESATWTDVVDPLCEALGMVAGTTSIDGQLISKCFVAIAGVLTALGVGKLFHMKHKEDKAAAAEKAKWEAERAAHAAKKSGKTSHMDGEGEINIAGKSTSKEELLALAEKIKQGDKDVINKAKEAIEKLSNQGKEEQLKKVANKTIEAVA